MNNAEILTKINDIFNEIVIDVEKQKEQWCYDVVKNHLGRTPLISDFKKYSLAGYSKTPNYIIIMFNNKPIASKDFGLPTYPYRNLNIF